MSWVRDAILDDDGELPERNSYARKLAEMHDATEGQGSWERRTYQALFGDEPGTGSWRNRLKTQMADWEGSVSLEAVGGLVTTEGDWTYHTFTSDDTFEVTAGSGEIEYIIIGGGAGGGGSAGAGGGGGAGGVITGTLEVSEGSYPVTTGAAGTGSGGSDGTSGDGGDTTFNGETAVGGGAGGSYDGSNTTAPNSGGSGGGGGSSSSGTFAGASGTADQGSAGGDGRSGASTEQCGGGGGGASGVGQASVSNSGGDGGDGVEWPVGSGDFYAGGGGGSGRSDPGGAGGTGGGGAGASSGGGGSNATSYGSGGGGGAGGGTGGNGSQGAVIIRHQGTGSNPPFIAVMAGASYLGATEDGISWTTVKDDTTFNKVLWVPELEKYVAVGTPIFTSPDGSVWTEQTNPSGNHLRDAVWAPELGLLVAVGGGREVIVTSSDGETWTQRDAGFSSEEAALYEVAWSGTRFVACRNADHASENYTHSTDGINWTTGFVSINSSSGWRQTRGVDWSPSQGVFRMTGASYFTRTSSDGLSWDNGGSLSSDWARVRNGVGMVWYPGWSRWLACQSGPRWSHLQSGTSWTMTTSPFADIWSIGWAERLGHGYIRNVANNTTHRSDAWPLSLTQVTDLDGIDTRSIAAKPE